MKTINWKIENLNLISDKDIYGKYKAEAIWTCDIRLDKTHSCLSGISNIELNSIEDFNSLTEDKVIELCVASGLDKSKVEQQLSSNLDYSNKINYSKSFTEITKEEYESAQQEGRITQY